MNENDSVVNKEIPAVVRALGTLALAAATAVVIKWFISRDKKEEKHLGDEGTNLQAHLEKTPEEDHCKNTGCNFPLATVTNNAPVPEVSDGVDDTSSDWSSKGTLKWCEGPLDTICIGHRRNSQEKGMQVAKDSAHILPGTSEVGDLTDISNGEANITACQDVCIRDDLYVGKPELSVLFRGVETNDIRNENLPSSCVYDSNNVSHCDRLLIFGEHGNSWAPGESSNVDEQICDATGKSSGSKVQNTLVDHSNILPVPRNLGLQHEKLAYKSRAIADEALTCFSAMKESDKVKSCITGQLGDAWNAQSDTLITLSAQVEKQSMLSECSENLGTDTIIGKSNSIEPECSGLAICESHQNKGTRAENFEDFGNDLSGTTTASRVIQNDLSLQAKDNELETTGSLHCSIISNPVVSELYEDSLPVKHTESYREISNLESQNTHEEYISQNDTKKQKPTQLQKGFQIDNNQQSNDDEAACIQPAKRNCVKPLTEWSRTKQVPQLIQTCSPCPDRVVDSVTTVEQDIKRSLKSTKAGNNKNVIHSSTEFSATTIYNFRYIDFLHKESSDLLHCDGQEIYSRDDPGELQRKRQKIDLMQSLSMTYAKMLSTGTDYDVPIEDVITNPNDTPDNSGAEVVAGISEVSDTLVEEKDKYMAEVGQLKIQRPDRNLEISHLIHPTHTALLSTTQDVSLSYSGTESNEDMDTNYVERRTGKNFHQETTNETAYVFQDVMNDTQSPVEFTTMKSSCQQPVLIKNLTVDGIFKEYTARMKNTNIKGMSENFQTKTCMPSGYVTGTLSSQKNLSKSTTPLVLTEEVDEKTTLRSHTLTQREHNVYKPQTTVFSNEQGQSDSEDISKITYEDPQNLSLSFNELKRLYSKIPETYSKNIPAIAASSKEKLLERNSALNPRSTMSLVTKSCENIHLRFSSQRPKLRKKTQSMLCLLTEYYSSKLRSSENGLIEEVSRGSFVRIPRSLHDIGETMRFQLNLGNCLQLLKLARKNGVPDLLKAVYTVISDNYLHVLKNSSIYGQLTGSDRERILQLRVRGKPSLCVVEIKSIFDWNKTGQSDEVTDPFESKAQIYALDMEKNQWNIVTCIPEEACLKGCSICTMHNYLFIAGGIRKTSESSTCSNKLFCYNPLTDIWSQLTPMNQARSQLKLVPVDGHLYAIGGECLHTMEMYDPRYNKWTFKAPLPKGSFAVAHEATECGGDIYISGGHLFYRLLKYSPAQDSWEECPFNGSKGRSCDMVAIKNSLYRFDIQRDSTISIFKYNTAGKIWAEFSANFPGSKMPFRCAVLNNTIYCLNRETTAHFTDGDDNAVFEAAVFSTFPTKGPGTPHPLVLSFTGSISQTSV